MWTMCLLREIFSSFGASPENRFYFIQKSRGTHKSEFPRYKKEKVFKNIRLPQFKSFTYHGVCEVIYKKVKDLMGT